LTALTQHDIDELEAQWAEPTPRQKYEPP